MFRRSFLPCFGLFLVFVSGLDMVVAGLSITDYLRQIFTVLDTDDNGLLSKKEFAPFYRVTQDPKKGITEQQIFKQVDANGDGYVFQTELGNFTRRTVGKNTKSMDVNGDGYLTEWELTKSHKYTACEAEKDMEVADQDGDGKASYGEFLAAVCEDVLFLIKQLSSGGGKGVAG